MNTQFHTEKKKFIKYRSPKNCCFDLKVKDTPKDRESCPKIQLLSVKSLKHGAFAKHCIVIVVV